MQTSSNKRIIVLGSELSEPRIYDVKRTLAEFVSESNLPVLLMIDTSTADFWSCLNLYEYLRLTVKDTLVEVHGMVTGSCCMLSLVVLQACSIRYATKHSRFLIAHNRLTFSLNSAHSDEVIISKLKEIIGIVRCVEESAKSVILSRSGISDEVYENLLISGDFVGNGLSAQRALELRLIDKIADLLPGRFGL